MPPHFEESAVIEAPAALVWQALTDLEAMKQWMGEPEMGIEIETDWSVGGPITIRGTLHGRFVNRGTVLQCVPNAALRYSHLSSISRLPDVPASYTVLDFRLAAAGAGTSLTVAVLQSPNEVTFKHLAFYWRGTLGVLKRFVEQQASASGSPSSSA
jgi:uncharacterized protein YndB with AHSA1/START domain